MAILTYKTKEEIPEDLRDSAQEKDGVYSVNVTPRAKVDEFRNSNIELAKYKEGAEVTMTALGKLYTEEVKDVEALAKELTELRAISQKVKDGKLTASDAIEAELAKRIKGMQDQHTTALADLQNQNRTLTERLGTADAKLRDNILVNAVREVIRDETLGLNPSAEKAILSEIRDVFKVKEDGTITATDATGNTMWGASGKDVITIREYADTELRKSASYVFKPSKGSSYGENYSQEGIPNAAERAKLTEDELWGLVSVQESKRR